MPREGVAVFAIATEPGLMIPAKVARQYAEQLGASAVLWADGYTPDNLRRVVLRYDPAFLFIESHGFPCSVTAQNVRPAISTPATESEPRAYCPGSINTDIVEGRVLHFNACWTGLRLGEVLVRKGALAFYGTKKPFLFLMPKDGKTLDRIGAAPFIAEYTVEVALMSGMTTGQAQEARMRAYDVAIDYWKNVNHPASDLLVTVLQADKDNAVFLGREDVRVFPKQEKHVVVRMDTGKVSASYILAFLILGAVLGGGK